MFGENGKKEQAAMLLEKLMELLSGMPDKEDAAQPEAEMAVLAVPEEKKELA